MKVTLPLAFEAVGLQFLDVRVGAERAHAVDVEDADADDEVGERLAAASSVRRISTRSPE